MLFFVLWERWRQLWRREESRTVQLMRRRLKGALQVNKLQVINTVNIEEKGEWWVGPGKLLMIGVRNFADLRPKNRQICVRFLRI